MRSTPFGRVHLGIVTFAAFSLFGVALSSSTPASTLPATAAPQFLAWEGEPYADGYDHFLIEVTHAEVEHEWLRLEDGQLVASEAPPTEVGVGEIGEVIDGVARTANHLDVAAAVGAHAKVETVKPLPFGLYAVAGSITADELAGIPGVTHVAEDIGLEAATVDPYFPTQWGLDNDGASSDPWEVAPDADIDAPEGWHRTRGDGVVVAVVDSGVDVQHPDLVANIWNNTGETCGNAIDDDGNGYVDDCHGWDFANGIADLTDHNGHGTHVAGIIAAEADNGIGVAGVAYEADVMVLKIGDGTPALSAAIEAIAYAIENGAQVINASWILDDPVAAEFLDTAIAAAEDAGVLVVAAAGNEPNDVDTAPVYPAASSHENVITVAASTPTDQPAAWSAYGARSVDLYAPGEHIISTVPGGYGIYSGTSMAAPMVSGAAALLWAATPEANYAEVKGALLDRSDGPNDGVTAFRGLATSDGRLNINRSIYSAPLFQPSLMFNFYEFNSFEPEIAHKVAITAKTVDPWIVPPQTPAMYRAGLYVPVDGQPMAVVGQEMTYTGAEGDMTTITDTTGRTLIGPKFERQQRPAFVQDGDFTPIGMELPAGTYAFVMEIVDVTDLDNPVRMGDPSAVFFMVADDGSLTEMPQLPIVADPTPTTSTSEAPQTTATQSTATTTTSAQGPATTVPPVVTTAPSTTTTTVVSVATTTQPPAATTTAPPGSTTTAPTQPPAPTTTTTAGVTTTPPASTSSTTTTIATTTTTTTPTTTTTRPPGMEITGVNPAQGPVAGRTLATISGSELPEHPSVWFGDAAAEIISVISPSFIVVDTPPGRAGWVDVTVIDTASGETATLSNAFLYAVEGEEPPPPSPTTVPGTTTSQPSPTTTHAPTTVPGTTTSLAPSPTTQPPAPLDALDDWRDAMLRTPEGLQLAPPAADDPIREIALDVWIGALCDEPVCPGWVLES